MAAIHDELRSQKHVTLQTGLAGIQASNPDGYQYSRFCELYGRWAESSIWSCGKSIVLEKNVLSMSTPNARANLLRIR